MNKKRQIQSTKATGKVKSFGDKFEVARKEHKLDCSYGIIIFEFLTVLIREAKLAPIGEAQLHLALPRMLKKTTHNHFVSFRDCSVAAGKSSEGSRQVATASPFVTDERKPSHSSYGSSWSNDHGTVSKRGY